MTKLLERFANHPWWVLWALAIVSLLAGTQLNDLKVHVSSEELLVRDDPARDFQREVALAFGDERVNLLFIRDAHLLDPEKLKVLRTVVDELNALPFVERTDSLFSVPHLRTVDGFLTKAPYLDTLPADREAGDVLLKKALINPFLRHVLLSEDGQVMAVAVVLTDADTDDANRPDDTAITRSLMEITAQLTPTYAEAFNIGLPQVRDEIAANVQREQGELFPLAVCALLIALFVLLRQILDILIPIMTAALSILWTLGLMGLFGIPLNVVTSIVPILLIIVGSTEDIHLLSEFRHGQKAGLASDAAIKRMARKMGRIVLLTFLTSFIGFLTVSLSRIEVLFQFGLVAATGLALNFLITVSLIPALLALAGRWQLDGGPTLALPKTLNWPKRYFAFLRHNRGPVMFVTLLIAAAAASGIPQIHINHNAIDSLGDHSELRARFDEVNAELAGLESFSVVVDSGIEGTFLKARYINELVKIQQFIAKLDAERGTGHSSTSFADYLALLNAAFEELEKPKQPKTDDIVNELMLFLDYDHVKGYVTPDYSRARILVRHNIASTEPLQAYIDRIQGFIDTELDPGLRARISGDSVLKLSATRAMIIGQLQSIALLMAIIVIIIALLFADLKVGLLALLPNVFPVIVLFGVMGWFAIPLNIGTTMAAAIAIGLAVDDTMHFMLRYNEELKSSKSQLLAMHETLQGEALPIFATSIALITGFLVFSLSQFQPIAQFGLLSALVIASALIADFVITPITIAALRLVTLWDMLSLQLREDVIRKSPLFVGMRRWQIRRFILSSAVLSYSAGNPVFRKGDASNAMYLVMTGQVDIRLTKPDGTEVVVESFGPGALFGDVAVLVDETRRTDAIARVDTSVLLLTREAIQNTTWLHPGIAARLFYNLAVDIGSRLIHIVDRTR
ncbi:MAG: MMPL family transporter [Gammaproteobacteria bacterium]|nr:MMPL family transporter [Gammaproteobacteria bacterium]MCP5137086.1 MMPL family transporter [Gammaproteobacteria bacterium]